MNFPLNREQAIAMVEASGQTDRFEEVYGHDPAYYYEGYDHEGLIAYTNTFDDLSIPYEFPNLEELLQLTQTAAMQGDWELVRKLGELGVELRFDEE